MRPYHARILGVLIPPQRVLRDVPPHPAQVVLVPDDVFVVVPLPNWNAGRVPNFVDALGGYRLERPDQAPDGFAGSIACRGGSRTAPTNIADDHDALEMVRHHHVLVQVDVFISLR